MKASLLRGVSTAALCIGGAVLLATPLASLAFWATMQVSRLVSIGRLPLYKIFYCWWLYLFEYGSDPRFTLKLAVTGGLPFLLILLGMTVSLLSRRPRKVRPARPGQTPTDPERSASRVHGDADWLTMEAARETFTGEHPDWGYIPVGEAYRPDLDRSARRPFDENRPETWGQGGKSEILGSPLTTGALGGIIIGGSGSRKTTSFTIPAACTYRGSMIILDPSANVGFMIRRARQEMGQTVVLLDPEHPREGGFNVLSCIDITSRLANLHLEEFIEWCLPEKKDDSKADKNQIFIDAAKKLAFAILADLLWDKTLSPAQKTVREWRRRLVRPEREMKKELSRIYAHSLNAKARDFAGSLMHIEDETFSGMYFQATTDTGWLSDQAFSDLLSYDTFNPTGLIGGKMTVVLQISDDIMKTTPGISRVIIGSLARIVMRARGKIATPVPLIMDDMDLLGYMKIFEVIRDAGRRYGIALFPMWQSVGQITARWGESGKQAWYDSSGWRSYAMINNQQTAEEVSKRCGTYTYIAHSEGISTNTQSALSSGGRSLGTSSNVSEKPAELLSAYRVQTELREDEQILIIRGKPALRCGRSLFFRRPEMIEMIDTDIMRRQPEGAIHA